MDGNILSLIGVLIVIVGFALRLDSILIVVVAMIVTALVSGLGIETMLETLGSSFVANRGMAIFIIIMLATGTLERNGLKESAARMIKKFKRVNTSAILMIYGVFRTVFAAFNVSFGGVAGFVRPIVYPMMEGAVESKGLPDNEEYFEDLKGMSSAMENITWFFGQNLFIGGAGALLVQSTLKSLGYDVSLVRLMVVEIPVALVALVVACIYFHFKDKRLMKKYYGDKGVK
ncbi:MULTISPECIES: DUF969 domain-containing protein [Enterococcus]|uniref:DUF969 family protein n=1 Tax=Enterococcus alishanensis TaxID=1303817 RepID=A0ABS6TCV9_9ENTE|nr:DUF969 domain-containing protein [Enterococcus alishanensis]MBV7390720.1 DUF969 family protein [Enterococcus alishanensis]